MKRFFFLVIALASIQILNAQVFRTPYSSISVAGNLINGVKPIANWIWDSGEENPINYYLMVCRKVSLNHSPDSVSAVISAYAFADVYINGELLDRCPTNCDPEHQVYQKYDLSRFFHKGENVITALVYNFGTGMHHRIDGRGGFFFQGKFFNGKDQMDVNTDDTWLVRKADAWDNNSKFRSESDHLIGFTEIFDAQKMLEDWRETKIDDNRWQKAHVIGIPPIKPWNSIVQITRPTLVLEKRYPVKHWFVGDKVIYDFEKEVSGWPAFDIYSGKDGAEVTIGTAERLLPDSTACDNKRMNYTDSYISKKGMQQWSSMAWRGFRYLSVTRRDNTVIRDVYATNRHYAFQKEGSFACSDPLLNEIWNIGLFTINLCALDTYVDTPWREQTHYIAGDSRMVSRYSYYPYGLSSQFLMQYNILCAAWSSRWYTDGSIRSRYPTGWLLGENTSACLPDYELEWICMLQEYNQYFGDAEFLKYVYPNMKNLMNLFETYINPKHGLLANVKGWIVLDHPDTYPIEFKEEITGLNCLYYAALKRASILASQVTGDLPQAGKWNKQAEILKKNIQKWLWSKDKKLYADSYGSNQYAQQTQTYALLYDLVPNDSREKVMDYIMSKNRSSEQSFSYYLLSSMFDEREQWSLDFIRKYWGEQMKLSYFNGAWHECWDIAQYGYEFTTSHAWCSGPTALLPQKVLGAEPLENGWKKFVIHPHVCDLKWANGIIPSRFGSIIVDWKIENKIFNMYAKVPENTEAQIIVPGKNVIINSQKQATSKYAAAAGEYHISSEL